MNPNYNQPPQPLAPPQENQPAPVARPAEVAAVANEQAAVPAPAPAELPAPPQAMPQPAAQAPAGPQQPLQPSQGGAANSSPASTAGVPTIADDTDLIEKEWVIKAKQIVERTKDNPYAQSQELNKIKAEYIKKRYNKEIKIPES